MENHLADQPTIVQRHPLLSSRFELVARLGYGAAGEVFLVVDKGAAGKEVALKVLNNEQAFDESTYQRFLDEIRICQKIRHPNIIEAYDFIDLGGKIAYTMEYVKGEDLSALIARRRVTAAEIDSIFSQLLSALCELHGNKIIHRDVKLENILCREDGVVKLTDFGLIRHLEGTRMTKTGTLLGTAQYLPPEYIRTGVYDVRSDIFACGYVLYELLTGERWMSDMDGTKALRALLKAGFKQPEVTAENVETKYKLIMRRALDPEPQRRFQSAFEMREAFFDAEKILPQGVKIHPRIGFKEYPTPMVVDFGIAPMPKRSTLYRVLSILFFIMLGILSYIGYKRIL